MPDSSGWIIEHGNSHPTSPMFFKVPHWTAERDLAMRFAREEDAQHFAQDLLHYHAHRVVEFKPAAKWEHTGVIVSGGKGGGGGFVAVETSSGRFSERAFAPHCDARVLHAPGTCEHCDKYADWQAYRQLAHIAFTGVLPKSDEIACPSDFHRGLAGAHVWGGNCPRPHGKGGFSGPPENTNPPGPANPPVPPRDRSVS